MALTLRRSLRHFPAPRLRGALAALTGPPARPGHTAVGRRPRPSSSPARRADLRSEDGDERRPAGEPLSSRGHDVGGLGQNRKNVGGQVPCRRLSGSASSEDVLSLINGLRGPPRETPHNHVLRALCARLEREASSLPSTALLTALQALTLWDADPQSHLLLKLVAECQHRLQRGGLGAHGLCVLGESLIKLQGPGCATLGLVMHQLQGEKLENFRPEDIVALYRILQACTEKADQYQTFLNKINNFSLSVVSNLSPKLTSQVLTALVALDQTQALPLVIKLGKHVVRHIPRFTSEELRKVLEAFVYFGHNDRFLTTALEQHVASLRLTPDPEVISTVAEYCSRKHILSEPILNAVAETFVCQSEKFSPSQISESIEAFGKLNYLPPNASDLFRKLEDILFTRFNYFPPKTLLKLLHSCSLIEYHPVNFMAKLYSPYFLQRLLGEESHLDRLSLAQLTQLLLTSILECPFYKGPKLLPKYQVKSFLTPCCALETPVDFQLYKSVMSGLMDVLGGRQYFASKVLTPYCYTVDVEIKLDEEGFVLPFTVNEDVHKRVALCIDGPKRFCLNSKHLLGKEAIKQRHLRFLGYEVVQLPYYEIEMLKSRLELVEYLQRKLFSQNTGICW